MAEFVNVEPPDRPKTPSRQKLCEEIPKGAIDPVTGLTDLDQPPYLDSEGFPVGEWLDVIVKVHPTNPTLLAAQTQGLGWECTLVVWRYESRANDGSQTPHGQWYAKETLVISLDGDVWTHGGPMDYQLPTYAADKMFLQFVSETNRPAAGNGTFGIGVYGDVPRPDDMLQGAMLTAPGAPPIIIVPSGGGGGLPMVAPSDCIYSNLYMDFAVDYENATTLTLRNLPLSLQDGGWGSAEVLAIARRPSAASQWLTYYRGTNLRCVTAYDAQNQCTVTVIGAPVFTDTDEIIVWLEGPPRDYDHERQARAVLTRNPDALHHACDGIVVNTVGDPGNGEGGGIRDYYFDMAYAGYHRMSLHVEGLSPGDQADTITVAGTNCLDTDITAPWQDISLEAVGVDAIVEDGLYFSLISLPVKRIRIRINLDGSRVTPTYVKLTRTAD